MQGVHPCAFAFAFGGACLDLGTPSCETLVDVDLILDAGKASASPRLLVQSGVVLGQQVLAHLGKVKVTVVLRGSLVRVAEDIFYTQQ